MASTVEKQVWIIDTISRRGRVTLKELSRLWEDEKSLSDGNPLSKRTFHRHREEIERIFGIVIRCDKRDMSRYFIDENESDIQGQGIRTWLLSTLAVSNAVNECREMRGRILSEKIPNQLPYLSLVLSCIRDNVKLSVSYRGYYKEDYEPGEFMIEPYCIKVFDQRWYLVGRSDGYPDQIRTYSLDDDRMLYMERTQEHFDYPEDFDPEEYFRYSYGIFHMEEKPQRIVLKVDYWQCKFLESLPLHQSQTLVESTNDYNIYEYRMWPTFELKQKIVSFGAAIEVLEPESFRQEVADYLTEAAGMYKKKTDKHMD